MIVCQKLDGNKTYISLIALLQIFWSNIFINFEQLQIQLFGFYSKNTILTIGQKMGSNLLFNTNKN